MTSSNNITNTTIMKVLRIAFIILMLLGLLSTASAIFFNKTNTVINQCLDIIIYILILLHYLKFYKIAHSNYLRYILLFFACVIAYNGLSYKPISKMFGYAFITVSIVTAFVSARLHKYNQNRWLLLFGFLLLLLGTLFGINEIPSELVSSYSSIGQLVYRFSFFNPIIQFVCISLSYLFRNYSHIKAGLAADAVEDLL